jgi:hypothetical protein
MCVDRRPFASQDDLSLGAQRTAEILVERYGAQAFDFAARQAAVQNLAGAESSVQRWRDIARALEELLSRRSG